MNPVLSADFIFLKSAGSPLFLGDASVLHSLVHGDSGQLEVNKAVHVKLYSVVDNNGQKVLQDKLGDLD